MPDHLTPEQRAAEERQNSWQEVHLETLHGDFKITLPPDVRVVIRRDTRQPWVGTMAEVYDAVNAIAFEPPVLEQASKRKRKPMPNA